MLTLEIPDNIFIDLKSDKLFISLAIGTVACFQSLRNNSTNNLRYSLMED